MKAGDVAQAQAGKGPASISTKAGSGKTIDQIKDYVESEFQKAGFDITVSVGISTYSPGQAGQAVFFNRALIPIEREDVLKEVLEFPELTVDEYLQIRGDIIRTTSNGKPVIMITSGF